jgi:peptidoglycan/LPS O-acetylase OafA/YrhL
MQHQMTRSGDRLPLLDVLRALAATLVLIFHYEGLLQFSPPSTWPEVSDQQLWFGLLGVELFFVISGAIILLTAERTRSTWQFAVGRIARLYPAYWASVAVLGSYLLLTSDISFGRVALNLTMLQKFLGVPGISPAYWTLAYELSFYVAIGLCRSAGLLDRIERLALAWLACAFSLRLLGVDLTHSRMALVFMPQFGHLFIAGMMIYRMVSGRATPSTLFTLLLCVIYSLFGRTDWAQISAVPYFVANTIFILVVWLAMRERRPLPVPSWLGRLGECSYSLYLFHIPAGVMLVALSDAVGMSRWIGIALAVPASLASAMLARQYIEVPGQKLIKRFFGPAKSTARHEAEIAPRAFDPVLRESDSRDSELLRPRRPHHDYRP